MVADLCFPIEIIGVATVREADGLALSSRNGYLTQAERTIAPKLYHALQAAAKKLEQGERDFAALEHEAIAALNTAGFKAEYFSIRDAASLQLPSAETVGVVILVAARLGPTRLIDNLAQSLIK